jgi:hypothetical protein
MSNSVIARGFPARGGFCKRCELQAQHHTGSPHPHRQVLGADDKRPGAPFGGGRACKYLWHYSGNWQGTVEASPL